MKGLVGRGNVSHGVPVYLHCGCPEAHVCEQLAQSHYVMRSGWDLNLRPIGLMNTLAGVVCLQVKLCDPHLSALEVRFSRRGAIQIYVYLYLYLCTVWLYTSEYCRMKLFMEDSC